MKSKPKVLVLRTAGTNCDKETAYAFELAGGATELVHINRLISKERDLSDYQILALPGGFTYGDDIASGKILANEIKNKLGEDLRNFVDDGKIIIGICNGFQVLVKSGFLPGQELGIQATLTLNDSARFEDRWVYLKSLPHSVSGNGRNQRCIWTKHTPEMIYLPVAHGEGKFVTKNKDILKRIKKNNQIVFQYTDNLGNFSDYPNNPNGSIEHIAGICDETGRVLGLMPHPERHIFNHQHPRWTNGKPKKYGDGLSIFKSGVEYIKKNL